MLKHLQHALARLSSARDHADCTRVKELLPLHVAHDLSAGQAQSIARHLQICAGCRAQADEYAASRAWLQTGAQATFEDEFYDDIRATVLRQIRQQQTPAPSYAPRFGRRFAYVAASLALLALVSALVWQVQRQNTPDRRKLIVNTTPEPKPALTREQIAPPPHDYNLPDDMHAGGLGPVYNSQACLECHNTLADDSSAPTPGTQQRSDQRPQLQQATNKSPAPRVQRYRPRVVTPRAVPPPLDVATHAPAPSPTPVAHDAATQVSSEVARIEMQTADPNIRIIWLAAQPVADDAQTQPEKR